MKTIALTLTFVFSNIAYSQSVWQASSEFCGKHQFGIWFECTSPKAPVLNPELITASTLESLKILPIENVVNYDFKCSSSRQFNVEFYTSESEFPISWNKVGKFRNIYPLHQQSNMAYSLRIDPPTKSIGIKDGCLVSIVSNTSTPNVEILTQFVDNQKYLVKELNKINTDLNNASDLPAKWSGLVASTQTLEDSATSIDREKIELENELKDLLSIVEEDLTDKEKNRMSVLPSMIEDFTSISKNLRLSKSDIESTLTIAQKCGSDTPDAFCIKSVETLITSLKANTESKKNDLKAIGLFLTSESERLKATSERLSNKLATLAKNIDQ